MTTKQKNFNYDDVLATIGNPNYKRLFEILKKHSALLDVSSKCGDLTMLYVLVTPDLAKDLMKIEYSVNRSNMVSNGTRYDSTTKDLTNEIIIGQWQEAVRTIKFNVFGTWFDGKHGMSAIVCSGKPVRCYFTLGHPEKDFEKIDRKQKLRKTADTLRYMCKDDPTIGDHAVEVMTNGHQAVLSSAINNIWRWRNGYLDGKNQGKAIPTSEHKEYAIKYINDLSWAYKSCATTEMSRYIPTGIATFLQFIMKPRGNTRGLHFLECIANGGGEDDIDITNAKLIFRSLVQKTKPLIRLAETVLILNRYCSGERIRNDQELYHWAPFSHNPDGTKSRRGFPKINGFIYDERHVPIDTDEPVSE